MLACLIKVKQICYFVFILSVAFRIQECEEVSTVFCLSFGRLFEIQVSTVFCPSFGRLFEIQIWLGRYHTFITSSPIRFFKELKKFSKSFLV